jgi:voltage-gated potassium channel
MVRALWRDRRVRSALGLVAVLGLYFAVPVQSQSSTGRLIGNLVITIVCMVVVAMVILREFRRMQSGEDLRFTGGQLLIAIEVVLVAFALTYYSLAVHSPGEMSGIQTRIDALYFSATTVTTVGYGDIHAAGQVARVITTFQLVFDVVFIASFARLLNQARPAHTRGSEDERPVP